MPSYQTLTCPECQVSLCLDCVLKYTPETAFPMHMSCTMEPAAMRQYTTNRSCASTLFRDPYMATVYYEYQRFYNTDDYVRLLEERVSNTEHEVQCITKELRNTQNRLASAKYELLSAKQKRRMVPPIAEETEETNICH
jgi:hypothetical protein